MEKMEVEKRASLLSLENFVVAERLQKEANNLDNLIKEHHILLRACLNLQPNMFKSRSIQLCVTRNIL